MPELWGWSYRAQDFWSLRAAAEDLRDAFYDDYTDPDAIFAACPDLATAAPVRLTQETPR